MPAYSGTGLNSELYRFLDAAKPLTELNKNSLVVEFGATQFKAVRDAMIDRAREAAPILPFDEITVTETCKELAKVLADMVKVQTLNGCRPSEICILTPKMIARGRRRMGCQAQGT